MSENLGESWAGRQLLITQRLRQRRADLGLTQKQVVHRLARCGVHTTNRALSSLEHGAGIDVAKLPNIAAALDCTVTYLIGLTVDPHRWEPDLPITGAVANGQRPQASPSASSPFGARTESLIIGAEIPEHRLRAWSAGADRY